MMTDDLKSKLRHLLVAHEGYSNYPYSDTFGNITIGIGYNLTARGLPDNWINQQFSDDITCFYNQLNSDYPWFKNLTENRQAVLIDMCFMGYKNFQEFKIMLDALQDKDYELAAREMLDSKWATQVKGRATQLAQIMLEG